MVGCLRDRVVFLRGVVTEARSFVTPGKEGRGKHDFVGIVLGKFYAHVPEFARSEVERHAKKNGWTVSGAWPATGKHVFDWEFDVWGERGGDVIVKINLWDAGGGNDGISYRVNVATVDRVVKKFGRWFLSRKAEMKRAAEEKLWV